MANTYNPNASWLNDPARKPSSRVMGAADPYGATATAQGADPNQNDPITGAPTPSPFGAVKPDDGASAPFVVGEPKKPGSFANLLFGAAPPRQQNAAAANSAISSLLAPEEQTNLSSERARSSFDTQAAEALRQTKEDSALSGRLATGQIAGDSFRASDKLLTQRRDMEGQLQAQRR